MPTAKSENWKRFGGWIRDKREAIPWTQEELAERVGTDRQTVYRIEKGRPTKRATVIKLAEALKLSPQEAVDIAFAVSTPKKSSPGAARNAKVRSKRPDPVEDALLLGLSRKIAADGISEEGEQRMLEMLRRDAAAMEHGG